MAKKKLKFRNGEVTLPGLEGTTGDQLRRGMKKEEKKYFRSVEAARQEAIRKANKKRNEKVREINENAKLAIGG